MYHIIHLFSVFKQKRECYYATLPTQLSPGLRVVQTRSNTIKRLILTCTTLVINTKVSFAIVDQ